MKQVHRLKPAHLYTVSDYVSVMQQAKSKMFADELYAAAVCTVQPQSILYHITLKTEQVA